MNSPLILDLFPELEQDYLFCDLLKKNYLYKIFFEMVLPKIKNQIHLNFQKKSQLNHQLFQFLKVDL